MHAMEPPSSIEQKPYEKMTRQELISVTKMRSTQIAMLTGELERVKKHRDELAKLQIDTERERADLKHKNTCLHRTIGNLIDGMDALNDGSR